MIDVEFAAQAWQMREGLVETGTAGVLRKMAKAGEDVAKPLRQGFDFWTSAEWWLRLDEGRGGSLLPAAGLDRDWLAKKCGASDSPAFMKSAAEMVETVRKAYDRVTQKLAGKI